MVFRTRGGRREGAGRKPAPGKRAGVAHRRRFELSERLPVHVTLRVAPHVYNLRAQRSYRVVEKALRAGASRFGVGLVQYSVQGNHIHLIVEARRRVALARSVQGLSIRIARAMNRVMGKKGRVFADRFHARPLRTPTEVKRAIEYVRQDHRRHVDSDGRRFPATWLDPCHAQAVTPARTWLLAVGWQRAP